MLNIRRDLSLRQNNNDAISLILALYAFATGVWLEAQLSTTYEIKGANTCWKSLARDRLLDLFSR